MKHKFSMTWCGWIIERRRRISNEIQIVHWYTRECTSSTCPKQHNNTHFVFIEEEMNIPCRISFETRGSKLGTWCCCVMMMIIIMGIEGGSERECSIRRDVCDDEDGFLSSCELNLNWKRGKIYDELMWAKSQNWSLLFIQLSQLESLFFLLCTRSELHRSDDETSAFWEDQRALLLWVKWHN